MKILRLSWRNIWRNRRRTLVTVAATTLALFMMLLYQSMAQGMLADMEASVLELEVGDLQIHRQGYLDKPSIYDVIEESAAALAALDGAGYPAAGRLQGGGLVAAQESSAGARLLGLDLAATDRVSRLSDQVEHGAWLDPGDPQGVVIGRRLARTLGVDTGDELVVLSQATDGSMANDLFRVRGILTAVGEGIDRSGVLMIEARFREFFVLPDGVHQIVVRRSPTSDLDTVAAEVRAMSPGLDVRTWRQLLPTVATMLDSATAATQIVSVMIYIAVGILILNAMLMAVFERVREFGVLKALGVEPRQVMSMIAMESALQTGLSIVCGLGLAAAPLWYFTKYGIPLGQLGGSSVMGITFSTVLHTLPSPIAVLGPIVILVVIVALAVAYPAFKAARISPVEAMRYQ